MAEEEKNERMLSPQMIKTFGAMAGGVVEACSLQPLDVLKTRMQISGKGLFPTLKTTLKNEGVTALYKGLSPFCTHLVLKYSVRWWFNDTYRKLLASEDGTVSTPASFLAGLMSGVTEAVLIVTPFEVVKTRLQTQVSFGTKLKYNGPLDVVRKVIKEEGVQSLWKGNGPTMVRQGWNQLLLFGPYGIIKEAVFDKKFHEPFGDPPNNSSRDIGGLARPSDEQSIRRGQNTPHEPKRGRQSAQVYQHVSVHFGRPEKRRHSSTLAWMFYAHFPRGTRDGYHVHGGRDVSEVVQLNLN